MSSGRSSGARRIHAEGGGPPSLRSIVILQVESAFPWTSGERRASVVVSPGRTSRSSTRARICVRGSPIELVATTS
jgi:hypothetical protein